MDDQQKSPMDHPDEQPAGAEGEPKFGRLLIILVAAVMLIVAITLASEALYS